MKRTGSCSLLLAGLACAGMSGDLRSQGPGTLPSGHGAAGTPDEARQAGLIEYRGRWLPKKLQPKLTAWEKADAKTLGWAQAYDVKSKHYRIKTDVPRFIVELEIKPFLDELYETYVRTFARDFGLQSRAANQKSIQIYSGYRTYKQQTGKTRGTPGFIVGSNVLHAFYEDFDPATFYKTTFHEGAHQFFAAVLPGAELPHWLNEALASYFEGGVYSRRTGKITLGAPPPDRVQFAKMQLARRADADPETMFMRVGRAEYTALHYALGWSFLYYLTATEDGRYRPLLGSLLRELNGSGTKPFATVFESTMRVSLPDVGKGWRAFVMHLPTPRAPTWVLARVTSLPEGVDLRDDDRFMSVAGVPIDASDTFTRAWQAARQLGDPFDVCVLRQTGPSDGMDFDLVPIRVRIENADAGKVSARGEMTRAHSLTD
ncbi:MAG: DUF1570 domain-containing protein [Planctomycetota bacterium]